jgi:uncharacterized protein YmfQ (DUF2313 family)
MIHSELLKRLLPPVAYDLNAPVLSAELEAEGRALDAAQLAADQILIEADPRTTTQLFTDWERIAGLPDSCCSTDSASTLAQRRSRLVEKLTSTGGQSRQYFIDLAAKLGYTDVSISEFHQVSCEDPCDAPLTGADWLFYWQVNVGDYIAIHDMTCEDPSDSPLRSWQSTELQCRINKLKPAHTVALMNWTMTQPQIDVVIAYGREYVLEASPALHLFLHTTLSAANYF